MTTQDIALGSSVHCWDGIGGRVARLVVVPAGRRLTHLVVERGAGLGAVVVPIERLDRVVDEAPMLNMSVDDLAGLPHFVETDYPLPDSEWIERHGYVPNTGRMAPYATSGFAVPVVPSWAGLMVREHAHPSLSLSQVPLGPRTRIALGDHTLGHLDHVLFDPDSKAVRALVVRRGHLGHRDVIVPVDWVQAITEEEVLLDADRVHLAQMPEYHAALPEEEITVSVQDAVSAAPHTSTEAPITPGTKTDTLGTDRVVAALPPIPEMEKALLAESALVEAVEVALAHDARTAQAAIDVGCQGGSIILSGTVGSEVERDAALEVARGATEAAVVLDELEVSHDVARRRRLPPDLETVVAAARDLAAARRT